MFDEDWIKTVTARVLTRKMLTTDERTNERSNERTNGRQTTDIQVS